MSVQPHWLASTTTSYQCCPDMLLLSVETILVIFERMFRIFDCFNCHIRTTGLCSLDNLVLSRNRFLYLVKLGLIFHLWKHSVVHYSVYHLVLHRGIKYPATQTQISIRLSSFQVYTHIVNVYYWDNDNYVYMIPTKVSDFESTQRISLITRRRGSMEGGIFPVAYVNGQQSHNLPFSSRTTAVRLCEARQPV